MPTSKKSTKIKKKTKKKLPSNSIFQSNSSLKISDWMPPIDKKFNHLDTHSWFDLQSFSNPTCIYVPSYPASIPTVPPESASQQLKSFKRRKIDKDPEFIFTRKIRIYPNSDQAFILNLWFDAFAKIYNSTILYLSPYFKNLKNINYSKINKAYTSVKKDMFDLKHKLQKNMDKNKRIPIHTLDEAIAMAISHFKTCVTNLKEGHIRKFRIREWSRTRNRKIIKLEGLAFNGKTFCPSIFPVIDASESLEDITKTCTLQYNSKTKKYILLVPTVQPISENIKNDNKCGIDLGIRTFATIYSEDKILSACNNKEKILKLYDKIDSINKRAVDIGYTSGLKKGLYKYHNRLTNLVKDMHYKLAHELVEKYDDIYLGKFSTKQILSSTQNTLTSHNKRILQTLSPYSFQMRLIHMGYKYGSQVTLVNEYKTTMTCSNCGEEKKIGASKEYKCSCKMEADRDENAAKNIMKVGMKK